MQAQGVRILTEFQDVSSELGKSRDCFVCAGDIVTVITKSSQNNIIRDNVR